MNIKPTNVSAEEFNVSIRIVILDYKMLSMEIFRQIEKENIVGYNADKLKGRVLGYVNDFRIPEYKIYLWVNKKGELRRFYLPILDSEGKAKGYLRPILMEKIGKINELLEPYQQLYIGS